MVKRRAKFVMAIVFVFLPLCLLIVGEVFFAVVTYNGMCPGIMDIDPYPCSLGHYIRRNTVSPFAFAANLMLMGVWLVFALLVLVIWWLIRRVVNRRGKQGVYDD